MYALLYIFGCQLSSAAEIAPNILFQRTAQRPRRRLLQVVKAAGDKGFFI